MICPNCYYEHGWNGDALEHIVGDKGAFYLPSNDIKATRKTTWGGEDKPIYFCPSCGTSFIET